MIRDISNKMRRSRLETEETRKRILSTASRMFLEKGLAAVGTREVMAGAGLTPGGFYRHFESKEQLIAEAYQTAFDRLYAKLESETVGKPPVKAVERIVSSYLSQSRRAETHYLCPLAGLGSDLGHSDPHVREVAVDGYKRIVQLIADRLTLVSKAEARKIAGGIMSTMVGAVTLAGIAREPGAARTILNDARSLIEYRLAGFKKKPG
jgi:TetR/AcrR family transcriptional regulator, transcriptional repressor for nem operon